MRKALPLWLAVVGFALIVPELWLHAVTQINPDQGVIAFTQFARIPLERLQGDGSVSFVVNIPDTRTWTRLRHAWGDPGYVLAAVAPNRPSAYCFDTLGLKVYASAGEKPVAFRTADEALYGYSTECQNFGLSFRTNPGAAILFRVSAEAGHKLPPGDLIVTSYWGADVKDKLVGMDLNAYVRPIVINLAACGVTLLLCALLLRLYRGYVGRGARHM